MKMRLICLVSVLGLSTFSSCSSSSSQTMSAPKDAETPTSIFDTTAALFDSGTLPDWNLLNSSHVIIGIATFNTSPTVAVDLAGVFYRNEDTGSVYYNGVFYSGAARNKTDAQLIASIVPIVNSGKLRPITLSESDSAYVAGYIDFVNSYFRLATDDQNRNHLVQARYCVPAAGCDLPDNQGHTQHYAQNELFGYADFVLKSTEADSRVPFR